MPDWNQLVRDRLNLSNLSHEVEKEITDELANHLSDLYDEYCKGGLSEYEATERAVSEVTDWQNLAKTIQGMKCEEEIVSNRTQQIWLPALLGLFTSFAWMIFLQTASSRLQMTQTYPRLSFLPNAVWFMSLAIIGGGAAFLSRRAGGSRSMSVAVAIFPSMAMALVWLLVLVVVVVRRQPFNSVGFGYGFVRAVIIPGICLSAGTLPLLKRNGAVKRNRLVS